MIALNKTNFIQSLADSTLFTRHARDTFVTIFVYVDDLIITRNSKLEICNVKKFILSQIKIKDLGKLKYFLGIEVAGASIGIFLSQRKYTLDLLRDAGLFRVKHVDFPMDQKM